MRVEIPSRDDEDDSRTGMNLGSTNDLHEAAIRANWTLSALMSLASRILDAESGDKA